VGKGERKFHLSNSIRKSATDLSNRGGKKEGKKKKMLRLWSGKGGKRILPPFIDRKEKGLRGPLDQEEEKKGAARNYGSISGEKKKKRGWEKGEGDGPGPRSRRGRREREKKEPGCSVLWERKRTCCASPVSKDKGKGGKKAGEWPGKSRKKSIGLAEREERFFLLEWWRGGGKGFSGT